MSKNDSSKSEPFNLETLKELIEMMDTHGLTEISLRQGDRKWKLRRGPQEIIQWAGGNPSAGYSFGGGGGSPTAAEPIAEAGSPAQTDSSTVAITSPTVGTFYSAPTPDDPPFVTVGSAVEPDTIVCIVEAMKVFNQIPAEVRGTIVEALVNNGDPVEFGQPLFRVRPV